MRSQYIHHMLARAGPVWLHLEPQPVRLYLSDSVHSKDSVDLRHSALAQVAVMQGHGGPVHALAFYNKSKRVVMINLKQGLQYK